MAHDYFDTEALRSALGRIPGPWLLPLWQFARGDTPIDTFEDWLCTDTQSRTLPGNAYLDLVALDYGNPQALATLRSVMNDALPHPAPCRCHTIRDRGFVIMGDDFCDPIESTSSDLLGRWWLHAARCETCGTVWTVAEDHLIYDVWLLSREPIEDWPEVHTYVGLLTQAKGTHVRWSRYDPMGSVVELPTACRVVLEENPDLSETTLAALFDLPEDVIRHHTAALRLR